MRFMLLAALVVGLDQLSKLWILKNFVLYESQVVIPEFFNLTLVMNRGAAFGFLAGVESAWRHYFFLILGSVALIILVIAWIRIRHVQALYGTALPLIAGGALGNMIDRLQHGAVVDFFDVYVGSYHWPAFNIADSAIFVGVFLFLIGNVLESRAEKKALKMP
ncbi:MAG: lipoprotein signal peptidase [Desulfobulbaceae bacterium]|uniref:Lipoprotein signal peptidase n=1 Tax=Candidatus Desulfatifera sulfidica TaxID=2841691 RepID=A0A8J6N8F6_9BACT|nr:lipoprotein signal peptidase [Candidatus Desulfatifera sulfidica]